MTPPVHLPGVGFLTADGRFYPEDVVRQTLLDIARWWGGLTDDERRDLSEIGYYAAVDREINDAVFGGAA